MNPARVPAVYLASAFSWFLSVLLFPRISKLRSINLPEGFDSNLLIVRSSVNHLARSAYKTRPARTLFERSTHQRLATYGSDSYLKRKSTNPLVNPSRRRGVYNSMTVSRHIFCVLRRLQ